MQKIVNAFKKYLLISISVAIVGVGSSAAFFASRTSAQINYGSTDCGSACCDPKDTTKSACVDKSQLEQFGKEAEANANKTKEIKCPNKQDCGGIVTRVLNPLINTMTAIVGIIVTISVISGAVMYSAAGGDPGKVSAAKKRITNSVIALIAYIFTFGLLQWLIPGGII